MNERQTIDRGWFYVREPSVPPVKHVKDGQGNLLTRRLHGYPARVQVLDESGANLPVATRLRAAASVGFALESCSQTPLQRPVTVVLGPAGTATTLEMTDGGERLRLDGIALSEQPTAHPTNLAVAALFDSADTPPLARHEPADFGAATERVLFFESLMNTDMPHNDRELSQGVLHMASSLAETGSEVVLANVKMPIVGDDRPVIGLESLEAALVGEPIGLICITLLEGYWEGVLKLINTLRSLGCTARIAVGGVMPTLTPEHVAAHLPEVSFVCRGAGEYFVPELCRILGNTPDDTPLSADQRHAFMQMDGILVVDQPGRALIAGNPAKQIVVESLDSVRLDLKYLEERHIQGGVELSTSRGCIHKCSFCSIIGRESYSARTTEGVFAVMDRYQARFEEIYGDHIPHNAYRVHISDDDFCCDQPRALAFFRQLRSTPFRLSSVQVSVADLCMREDGRLVPTVHPDWLEAMHPSCFADHGRPIPNSDFFEDHKSRNWSSFLQIGVETFADRELIRLAKGYRVEHIRAVVSALARRQLHMDAYFIASNSDTTALDFVDSLTELCRLKLRHPRHFHLRFPIVPHLVSYFPSATHRRKIRRGWRDTMAIRGEAKVPNHGEFDYLFVDYDIPGDAWVAAAVDANLLTDENRYTTSLVNLRACWMDRLRNLPAGDASKTGERMIRRLDDGPRRLLFEFLEAARQSSRPDYRGTPLSEALALEAGADFIGEPDSWLPAFARFVALDTPQLAILTEAQGQVIPERRVEQSVDFLLATHRDHVALRLFVDSDPDAWQRAAHAVGYLAEQRKALGKTSQVRLSCSANHLDPDRLGWLKTHGVSLDLTVDIGRSQATEIAKRIAQSDVDAIVAVPALPTDVDEFSRRFTALANLGHQTLEIQLPHGHTWSSAQQKALGAALFAIGKDLRKRSGGNAPVSLANLAEPHTKRALNNAITVVPSGDLYGCVPALLTADSPPNASVGHLDDLSSYDRAWMACPSHESLVQQRSAATGVRNEADAARVLSSFVSWMQREGLPAQATPAK